MPIRRDVIDGFLAAEITEKERWIKVDGTHGVFYYLFDDVPSKNGLFDFTDMYTGEIESHEVVDGYGARLSAPGYLDCTDWNVFDTEEEAIKDLIDNFGDMDGGENIPDLKVKKVDEGALSDDMQMGNQYRRRSIGFGMD